jgi:predicted metal-dependent phosphoesterase TrpH
LIDLHTHTNASDGSYTPAELVDAALNTGLEALAISDHDTFAGYDEAAPVAARDGLELIPGVELSTRMTSTRDFNVHILGYFLNGPPSFAFRTWLENLVGSRRERNVKLVEKLQSMGIDITLPEVEALGRTITGRPHFARLLVRKGHAANTEAAFRDYLAESAPAYVQRRGPPLEIGIQQIAEGGGLPVLAHPVRLGVRNHAVEDELIGKMRDAGLRGIEAYHSDHPPEDVARYLKLAEKLDLAVTGGTDFHGSAKPDIALGTGLYGNVNVPYAVLERLKALRK